MSVWLAGYNLVDITAPKLALFSHIRDSHPTYGLPAHSLVCVLTDPPRPTFFF
jgi:hypothetical protein